MKFYANIALVVTNWKIQILQDGRDVRILQQDMTIGKNNIMIHYKNKRKSILKRNNKELIEA